MASLLQGLGRSMLTTFRLIEPNVIERLHVRTGILSSLSPQINLSNQQIRGFKDKGVLKLRCNKCYFKKLDDRWWVLCSAFPRHKQREKVEDHRFKWIVTHLTRGGRPFQKKPEAYICDTSPPAAYDYKKRIWHDEEVKEGKSFPRLRRVDYRF